MAEVSTNQTFLDWLVDTCDRLLDSHTVGCEAQSDPTDSAATVSEAAPPQ